MTALGRRGLLIGLGLLGSGCVSYKAVDTPHETIEKTETKLESMRIARSNWKRTTLNVQLHQKWQSTETVRTEYTRVIEYTHDSIMQRAWKNHPHERFVIFFASPFLIATDLVAWVFTGPAMYIAGAAHGTAPETTRSTRVKDWSRLARRSSIVLVHDASGALLSRMRVGYKGWVWVSLGGFARRQLARGVGTATIAFVAEGHAESPAKYTLNGRTLLTVADASITGSPKQRYAAWMRIFDACPKRAKSLRTQIWRMARRPKAELDKAAAAKAAAERRRQAAIAAAAARAGRLKTLDAQVARIDETAGDIAAKRRTLLAAQLERGELLLKGLYPAGDGRNARFRTQAKFAFGEAAKHASDLDDLKALAKAVDGLKRSVKR